MTVSLRLLLVEDSEYDANLLVRAVRQGGYDIACERVEAAEELTAALQRQDWDMILADYTLPSFDAFAVLAMLKQRASDLPVIIVSGTISEEVAVECMKRGAADYLFKDRLGRLGQAIERALAERALRAEQRRSEARYRTLVETSPDAIIHTDLHATILMTNQRTAELYHCASSADLVGRIVLDLVVPEERPRAREDLRAAGRTGRSNARAYTAQRPDGTTFPIEVSVALLRAPDGQPDGLMVVAQDISARRQMEEALAFERDLFQALMDAMPDAIYFKDAQLRFIRANRAAAQWKGVSDPAQLVGMTDYTFYPDERVRAFHAEEQRIVATGEPLVNSLEEEEEVQPDHTTRWILTTKMPIEHAGQITGLVGISRDITELKRAEDALRQQLDFITAIMRSLGEGVYALDAEARLTYMNPAAERMLGWREVELRGKNMHDAIHFQRADGTRVPAADCPLLGVLRSGIVYSADDDIFMRKDGTVLPVAYSSAPIITEGQVVGAVLAFGDITARRQAEEAMRFQAHLLNMVGQAISATDLQGTVIYWNRAAERLYGWTAEEARGRHIAEVMPAPSGQPRPAEIIAHVASGQDWSGEQLHRHRDGHTFPAQVTATPVLDHLGAVIGGVGITTDITAQKEAEDAIRRHVERLVALRAIDVAITTSLDLRVTLGVVLEQVTAQLGVHAADVLLLHKHTHILEYAAGCGFRGNAVSRLRLRLGEGHAGRAALERRRISAPDLTREEVTRVPLVAEEQFVAYMAVPLIAQGQVQGVLEVFHRAPLYPDAAWLDFLDTLTGQAAIAIHNATLFAEFERSSTELMLAYDTTIEGWSRALDLRDKETEGHSQRVTALTVALAEAMGMSDAELVHVRRGALLHDIGKMGIPDAILHKPGPLSDEEWMVMRRHPTYAYELLAPIAYLRPALDIPYQHHEKWDGTGYPQGLKGEQIALAARIFAVADVWDALTSERRYRTAWSVAKTYAHVRALSGRHFDPAVVEALLRLGLDDRLGDHPPDADTMNSDSRS